MSLNDSSSLIPDTITCPSTSGKITIGQFGIFISPFHCWNKTADDLLPSFEAFGPVSQLRIKNSKKLHNPYVLVWFKSKDDATHALTELAQALPEGTKVEWIRSATPAEIPVVYASTIEISPLAVPLRSSKGYSRLNKKIRELCPLSEKVNLKRGADGMGSALVHFKSEEDAQGAMTCIGTTMFGQPVTVKPYVWTPPKTEGSKKVSSTEHNKLETSLAAAIVTTETTEKAMARAAAVQALSALSIRAQSEHAEAEKLRLHHAAKEGHAGARDMKRASARSGAPGMTPAAKTAQRQPTQHTKVPSRRSKLNAAA